MQPIHFLISPTGNEIPDSNFVDVLSPISSAHCDRMARRSRPLKDDPYLLGYSMTDCLFHRGRLRERTDTIGALETFIGWPRRLRTLGRTRLEKALRRDNKKFIESHQRFQYELHTNSSHS